MYVPYHTEQGASFCETRKKSNKMAESVDERAEMKLVTDDDYVSHSDDEEWETYAQLPRPPSFAFYQYGFHSIADSLHSLAGSFHHGVVASISDGWNNLHDQYATLSAEYTAMKERSRSPSPTNKGFFSSTNTNRTSETGKGVRSLGAAAKRSSTSPKRTQKSMFDVREFQKTQEREKLSTCTKISRFRPKSPTWDGSFYVSKAVQEQLYRTPCRDPSGKLILSMGRDEAKGVPAWKAPQSGKDLDPPTFTSCSESYQEMVLRFMDEVIEKVEREYRSMPENSQFKATLKAKAGADLNNLKQERRRLREELENKQTLAGSSGKVPDNKKTHGNQNKNELAVEHVEK